VVGAPSPAFADVLSLARYENKTLMDELDSAESRGLL
jgi:D-arginine dehydrogenase